MRLFNVALEHQRVCCAFFCFLCFDIFFGIKNIIMDQWKKMIKSKVRCVVKEGILQQIEGGGTVKVENG